MGKLRVLFVGDSITCEGSRPRGFITKIQSILPIEHQVVCLKGATSIEIVDLLEQTSLEFDPVFIIAQSGINDLLNGCTQDKVCRSQVMLLEKLLAKFPKSKIIFLPIHPLKLPTRGITEVPSPTPANFLAWWNDPLSFVEDSLLADGIHLNSHGHSLLAKIIVHKIFSRNS
jgi:lysophospholipase L1-like esterase